MRLAERFPLTRPIAQREARALFDICAGFVYSQTLLACVRLNLFEALSDGPVEEANLARRLGIDAIAVKRLLTASSALRLTKRHGKSRWGLARLGSAMLVSPGLAEMVEHHAVLYRDLLDPVALLKGRKGTELSAYWPYAREGAEGAAGANDVTGYTGLMAATMPAIANEILDAVSFRRYKCLLDAGGGDGTFLRAAAARFAHLNLILFDLPGVTGVAKEQFDRGGLQSRVQIAEGDLKTGTLPAGADVITLIRILLDHGDAGALQILKSVRRALPENGALVLAEPMAATKGAESAGAYFSFYLMAMGEGRPRSKDELTAMLKQAGFEKVTEIPTCQPLLTRILLAE